MTSPDERELLRETVAALLTKHAGPAAVRTAMDSDAGYDTALWQLLCEQVGVAALVVPEEFGGAGGELADAAAVLGELGRALVPHPLWGTALAALALLAADEPDGDTLAALAAGEVAGAVVFDPDAVVHGDAAQVLIGPGDDGLYRWRGAEATALPTVDPTRRLARLHGGERTRIGADPGLADLAAILLAAEQVGAATRCLELTVEYTGTRVQFGRPIGSFQALKHRMADMYVAVQAAGAVVAEATAEPGPVAAARARLAATEAFDLVAAEAVQLHGGIAITWESDIQLYFKRAHGSAQLLGPPRTQVRQLERHLF